MKRLALSTCLIIVFAYTYAQDTGKPPPDIPQIRDTLFTEELKETVTDNTPVITLDDNEMNDAATQNISSQLTAGRDPFYSAASFNFSPARFRMRGYDNDLASVYINGIQMDNLDNGYTPWGLWGGLNDVFKNRDVNLGTRYNTFGFGDISSTTNIDVRASKQRKQTSAGYALSNRNYTHRFSVTHSTGLSKNGWAFTLSGSFRQAGEGYVPGTYYKGYSWFVAADKKLGQKHLLSFVAFGAPVENGRQGGATQEMMALAGTHYYNPSWGYQDGKKRNANVAKTNQPVIMLVHDYRMNNNTTIVTSVGAVTGERAVSGIDWYNAPDPRPDYYRYMPSYYETQNNPVLAQQVRTELASNESARQLNWDNFYHINKDNSATIQNVNGVADSSLTGNRAYYMLGERVTKTLRLMGNAVINSRLSNHLDITAGISFQATRNNYFQRAKDLLGGSFWVNLNQFAQRSFPNDANAYQNDLNHPNRIIKTGDKYGYDYNININKPEEWVQLVFKYNKIDFYIAGDVSQTKFWRDGNVRNGLFPENSYGKSDVYSFDNYAVKGGITYKLNGRHYLYATGAVLTRAPYYDNAFVSPRTRDNTQDDLRSEAVQTAEAGYVLNAPKIKVRLSGYYTSMQHGFNVLTFYHDEYQDFVNYALSNIDRLYFGGELGAEAKVARNLTVNAAVALGRYYYNSRQNATVTVDNTAETVSKSVVYSQNYRIAGTPQEAYSAGITYRSPKFWFVSLTANYFDQMWLDFNPLRRTYAATDGVTEGNGEKAHSILDQTRLKAQYTIDFFGGYSYKLPHTFIGAKRRPLYIAIYTGISNLTNNKDIVTGGYEQLRYDFSASAQDNLSKFPAKYYYAYGLNYFLSFQVRF